jgi:hypothetical protein
MKTNNFLSSLLCIAFIALLSGCTTTMKPATNGQSRISTVDEKNYDIGQVRTVYVGEQILSRKAYDIIISSNHVRPSNDFSLTGGIGSVSVSMQGGPNDQFRVVATNDLGNAAVAISGSHLAFGIDKEGKWDGTVASGSFWTAPVGSGSQYKFNPPNTKFTRVESKRPVPESGYINHELVFSGISADGLHLLYREYTFENMARSAFTQDLHYSAETGGIRFRKYKIKIISHTASSITYVVESD